MLDEGVELSAQHILPHFRECWWDHILCDILLSNIPAITAGMFAIRYFGIREYDWLGRKGKASFWEWDFLHCHKKFGAIAYQQVLLLIHFLSGFFIMNALLIQPKHFFPIARLLLWFGFGAVAHREAYIDVSSWGTMQRKQEPVEGRFRWLTVAALSSEMLLTYKYREGTGNLVLDAVTPVYIWLPWTVALSSLAGYWFYLRFKKGHTVKYPGFEADLHTKVN